MTQPPDSGVKVDFAAAESTVDALKTPELKAPAEGQVDRLLAVADLPKEAAKPEGIQVGVLVEVMKDRARVQVISQPAAPPIEAKLHSFVDADFLREAHSNGQLAIVQFLAHEAIVLGVIQARAPEKAQINADELELVGMKKLTLRSGRAALNLRADGQIEMMGTRITATSRGVMKFLARALRLN